MRSAASISKHLGDLLFGTSLDKLPRLLPGTLVAALLAWISILAAQFIGQTLLGFQKSPVSSVMVAVLLGMAIGNSAIPLAACKPGFTFAVKKLLRLGIMLLGLRLSVVEALRFGLAGIPVIVACIAGAFIIGQLIARGLRLSPRLGTLIAVGTSICGVSAIAAAGPAIDAKEEEISYAVAIITVFGIIATLIYPYICQLLFGTTVSQVGLFLGTAVHDTSQVTGAALVYEQVYDADGVLNIATVTKLVRNLFMIAVIPLAALFHANQNRKESASGQKADQTTGQTADQSGGQVTGLAAGPGETGRQAPAGQITTRQRPPLASMVPLFIFGFVLFSVLRSIGDAGLRDGTGAAFGIWRAGAWKALHTAASDLGQNLIVTALAGVGLTTSFKLIKGMGIKPFIAGLGAALAVGVVSFGMIRLFAG